ncbi:MAG: biotin transporter BioY [Flavobacteriaceae bacterium]|nr:biotin transporter BioY [Flavobacteriaceae bacterium]
MAEIQIPVTGQSFAVLLIAYIFGLKKGMLAVALYLLLGILGLQVFAEGKSGLDVILGNSGGFLIGFLFASAVVGYWAENRTNSFQNTLLSMFIGTVIILMIGVFWLSYKIGFSKAVEYGFVPFLPGAVIKIFLGAIAAYFFVKLRHKKTASKETV